MKRFNILLVLLVGIFSCVAQKESGTIPARHSDLGIFYGEEFEVEKLDDGKVVWQKYIAMAVTDTLALKFESKVKEVCKVKGCWMVVELPEGEQAMVRFKEYGFFIPSDIADKKVVLKGLAFVEEMSVEDQRHYAADAAKSAEEIAKINTPKRTFSFEASGVLVPN